MPTRTGGPMRTRVMTAILIAVALPLFGGLAIAAAGSISTTPPPAKLIRVQDASSRRVDDGAARRARDQERRREREQERRQRERGRELERQRERKPATTTT